MRPYHRNPSKLNLGIYKKLQLPRGGPRLNSGSMSLLKLDEKPRSKFQKEHLKFFNWAWVYRLLFASFNLSAVYMMWVQCINSADAQENDIKEDRYVTVHVWFNSHGTLLKGALNQEVGHVALSVHDDESIEFMSFWPEDPDVFLDPVRGHFVQFADDVYTEAEGKYPDVQIKLYSLDIDRIKQAYVNFQLQAKNGELKWQAVLQMSQSMHKYERIYNCATMTWMLLLEGGIKEKGLMPDFLRALKGPQNPYLRKLFQNDNAVLISPHVDALIVGTEIILASPQHVLNLVSRAKEIELKQIPKTEHYDELFFEPDDRATIAAKRNGALLRLNPNLIVSENVFESHPEGTRNIAQYRFELRAIKMAYQKMANGKNSDKTQNKAYLSITNLETQDVYFIDDIGTKLVGYDHQGHISIHSVGIDSEHLECIALQVVIHSPLGGEGISSHLVLLKIDEVGREAKLLIKDRAGVPQGTSRITCFKALSEDQFVVGFLSPGQPNRTDLYDFTLGGNSTFSKKIAAKGILNKELSNHMESCYRYSGRSLSKL